MIEDIERIIKIFEGAKITKLDLEVNDIKIKLEKEPAEANIIYKEKADLSKDNDEMVENNNTFIKSPVVGTFYAAKSEKADPFVVVGQKVKKGDTLCIVEAMKVLNEVTSDRDGVIVNILAKNEDLVMFDQSLFEIGDLDD
ncbi:MAG: hypothetical protein K6G48_03155 [Acholeplasmatales bacterium]|nr:hypothetical protein [Acholeplasmatales bacterium]